MTEKLSIFKKAVAELISRGLITIESTQKDIADKMGANYNSVNYAYNGNERYLTPSFLKRFNKAFENIFDEDWLLSGKGSMLKEVANQEAVQKNDLNIIMIPLVSQYAQAGYLCGFADEDYMDTLPTVPFVVDHHPHGNYVAFEVRGDSMFDGSFNSLMDGDLLKCREIHFDHWSSKLFINRWNNFVVIHKTEGVLVKKITDHDVDNGVLTLHSLNPLYEDIKVKLSDIAKIFNVVKIERKGDK